MIYKKVLNLKTSDRAYIAGLIDGEGTITLSVKQKGGTEHLGVFVSSTEFVLMKYLIQTIGAGKITRKNPSKMHHSIAYAYAIYNRQALTLLRMTSPYLRTYKRQRCEFVLKHYIAVTKRNGKYTPQQQLKRDAFVKSFMKILPVTKKPS